MSDDNIHFLRPKGQPLTPMTQVDWGLELIKTYLISQRGMSSDQADVEASKYSDNHANAVAAGTMKTIETLVEMITSGEFDRERLRFEKSNNPSNDK